ncbi:purple acid phosphatase family protein [Paenibacillus sp. MMS18-CY102]|uniref:purple acid phosphatase family protein n=1 Tax=Paenibacillus sp. MMS18-CY102 TaxID=2682849 RepID=UPI0013657F17|nr:metallophosphoesterase family protein [Paenibacillus sp. MMS18-CY102]MWC29321.1 metallophosphoesterase [Paenibacillus sp. MMS18-CY102]
MVISKYSTVILIIVAAALLLGILAVGCTRNNKKHDKPYSIVMTLTGDAATSRAFTWMSDNKPDAPAVIELSVAGQADSFEPSAKLTFTGQTSPLATSKRALTQGVHKAEVSGLTPNTTYAYRVGSGLEGEWSDILSFRTDPLPQEDTAMTFINVTDSQGVTSADFKIWGQTLNQAFKQYPNARFIVHNGDLTENPEDAEAWAQWFAQAVPAITRVPILPVTGNHDVIESKDAPSFWPITARFNLPNNGAADAPAGTNYSLDIGTAHIAVLNTETAIDEQAQWLREDLAATAQPWLIVAVHRGPYGGNTYKKVKEWTEIFDTYKVDLVLQGHNHEYSRSYPLRDGQITGKADAPVTNHAGTVYVVTNASGVKLNDKKEDKFYHAVHLQNGQPMFAAITIQGDKLAYEAFTADGAPVDRFVIQH